MESTSGLAKAGENGKLLPFPHFPSHPVESGGKSNTAVVEEQPSWLDDLLNDSDALFHRGHHRRSASDSCAYFGAGADPLAMDDESEFVNAYFGSSHTKDSGEVFSSVGVGRSTLNVEGSADKAAASQAKTHSIFRDPGRRSWSFGRTSIHGTAEYDLDNGKQSFKAASREHLAGADDQTM